MILLGILELGDLVDEVLLGVGAARHARPHLVHLLGDLAVLLLGRLPLPDYISSKLIDEFYDNYCMIT